MFLKKRKENKNENSEETVATNEVIEMMYSQMIFKMKLKINEEIEKSASRGYRECIAIFDEDAYNAESKTKHADYLGNGSLFIYIIDYLDELGYDAYFIGKELHISW